MNPRPSEMIILILDPVTDIHHQLALKAFTNNKLHVSIFSIPNITFDPRTHILVPKHKIVPQEEIKDILEKWNLTSKLHMPMIRYHVDPIVRILGGVIGDVIEITRPSPTAGTYTFYRVVSP
jgi:DNA-directed RNA polymerase subunit H